MVDVYEMTIGRQMRSSKDLQRKTLQRIKGAKNQSWRRDCSHRGCRISVNTLHRVEYRIPYGQRPERLPNTLTSRLQALQICQDLISFDAHTYGVHYLAGKTLDNAWSSRFDCSHQICNEMTQQTLFRSPG